MKNKLRLSLEDLRVETFTPEPGLGQHGTVLGRAIGGEEDAAAPGGTIFSACPSCGDTCPATCSGGCQVTECGSACRHSWNDPACYTKVTSACNHLCRADAEPA